MGYKMIVLNMFNRRHHDYYIDRAGGRSVYALASRAFLEAWVNRVRNFDNMVVSSEKTTYDYAQDSLYYATFNDGKIGVSISGQGMATFGTKKSGDGDYDYTGLKIINFADFGYSYGNTYSPWSARCRLFVSGNNLIASSGIASLAYNKLKGFFFANGGVMSMDAVDLYSMGASPAVIGSMFQNMPEVGSPGVLDVYRSDMLIENSNGFEILDHVQYIWSPEISRGSGGTFEEVTIDGKKYIHMGINAKSQYLTSGMLWLPVEEIIEEDVEVFIHESA